MIIGQQLSNGPKLTELCRLELSVSSDRTQHHSGDKRVSQSLPLLA